MSQGSRDLMDEWMNGYLGRIKSLLDAVSHRMNIPQFAKRWNVLSCFASAQLVAAEAKRNKNPGLEEGETRHLSASFGEGAVISTLSVVHCHLAM